MADVESWVKYRIHLVNTLDRLDRDIIKVGDKVDAVEDGIRAELARLQREEIGKLRSEIIALQIEFGMQKVRVGLLASGAGAVIAAVMSFVMKALLK